MSKEKTEGGRGVYLDVFQATDVIPIYRIYLLYTSILSQCRDSNRLHPVQEILPCPFVQCTSVFVGDDRCVCAKRIQICWEVAVTFQCNGLEHRGRVLLSRHPMVNSASLQNNRSLLWCGYVKFNRVVKQGGD